MRLLTLLFLLSCWLQPDLYSQPDWLKQAPIAFAELDQEAADSISLLRERCNALRQRMEDHLTKSGAERDKIFGFQDGSFKEGMSKKLQKEPGPLLYETNTNPELQKLEDLHLSLYREDIKLLRWLDIENRLKKHPDRSQMGRWALTFRKLPPGYQQKLADPIQCQYWMKTEVVCQLVAEMESTSPDKAGSKLRSFDLKFDAHRLDSLNRANPTRSWAFPLPPEVILYSFPMHGQYSFRREESIPGLGYVVLPTGVREALTPLQYSETAWRARWCSASGRVTYSAMELRDGHQFFFNLPDRYFKEGELYRLEILAMPKGSIAPFLPEPVCWQAFRGRDQDVMPTQIRLLDEVKITELFFRVGKTSVERKVAQMEGVLDWEKGIVNFETDEPWDRLERFGNGYFDAVNAYTISTAGFYQFISALESKELFYYLQVPRVEQLKDRPLEQLAVAERDNTLGAAFIEDVRKGSPGGYGQMAAHPSKNIALHGGYSIPPFSRAFAPDTIIIDRNVPIVNGEMFYKNKQPSLGKARCQLLVGELRQFIKMATLQKQQIERRIEERANFFYELELRAAKREGRPAAMTLEAFRERELANLPAEVKTIRESTFPDNVKTNFVMIFSRFYPGSKQRSYELTIKFK